jgi:hypothetical protein
MSSNFYITDLNDSKSGKSSLVDKDKEEIKKINDNFSLTNNSIKKDEEKTLEKTKHNILDFLIREETDYADLYKVEKYFREVNISNLIKFNRFNKQIKKKKEEIDEVQELINREIIENIDLDIEEMLELYSNEKERIIKNINKIDHDMEIYREMREKLYKNNVKRF